MASGASDQAARYSADAETSLQSGPRTIGRPVLLTGLLVRTKLLVEGSETETPHQPFQPGRRECMGMTRVEPKPRQDPVDVISPWAAAIHRDVQPCSRSQDPREFSHHAIHILDVIDAVLDDREVVSSRIGGELLATSRSVHSVGVTKRREHFVGCVIVGQGIDQEPFRREELAGQSDRPTPDLDYLGAALRKFCQAEATQHPIS
jgi:hypothetical protein